MPNVINIARDIMAICGPLTGTRSSGSADMIASGADYNLKESTYLIPSYRRRRASRSSV